MVKKLAPLVLIALAVCFLISFALFFMNIGPVWELKLFELPIVLVMALFLVASFFYEESMRELFQHLEIQRFAAFVALTLATLGLMTKIF